jgi:hypothetical protein
MRVDLEILNGLNALGAFQGADFTGFRHPVSRELAARFAGIGRAFHG